ncbi:MAG TPA: hypothetical protein VG266_10420 [Candidatus Dormibacteraeota bacterium]|jgi:branched-subunit amino acid ABC-type transport system permease component|nr:hypothetical protein [Candidatus Dormibacteraeota bacterium]
MSGGVALQLAFDSIAAAAIYALVALGVYAAHCGSGVLHLAAGDAAMVGAVVAAALVAGGLPAAPGAVVAIVVAGATSLVMERVLVRPSGTRAALAAAALVAGGICIRQGLSAAYPNAAYPFPYASTTWRVGDGVVRASDVITVIVAAVIALCLGAVVRRTRAGAALRVTAASPTVAETIGVDTATVRAVAFALAGALAGLAAILAAGRVAPSPTAGVPLALKGLAAAVAGGLGAPLWICAAALLIGATEAVAGYAFGGAGEVVTYAVAMLAVALRWSR